MVRWELQLKNFPHPSGVSLSVDELLPSNLEWLLAHRCTALESGLIFSVSFESPLRHFDLSGDFKLDRNEVRGVVEDALQDMQLLAAARWKQKSVVISFCPRMKFQTGLGFKVWDVLLLQPGRCLHHYQPHHVLERCDIARTEYVESDHLVLRYYLFRDEDLNGFREHNCDIETVAVQFYFQDFATSERLECCGVKPSALSSTALRRQPIAAPPHATSRHAVSAPLVVSLSSQQSTLSRSSSHCPPVVSLSRRQQSVFTRHRRSSQPPTSNATRFRGFHLVGHHGNW
ncbi:hypothetical protein WN943_014212 [Citrus x changshan-huyou]